MRKIVKLMIAAALPLMVTACGPKAAPVTNETMANETAANEAEATNDTAANMIDNAAENAAVADTITTNADNGTDRSGPINRTGPIDRTGPIAEHSGPINRHGAVPQ